VLNRITNVNYKTQTFHFEKCRSKVAYICDFFTKQEGNRKTEETRKGNKKGNRGFC